MSGLQMAVKEMVQKLKAMEVTSEQMQQKIYDELDEQTQHLNDPKAMREFTDALLFALQGALKESGGLVTITCQTPGEAILARQMLISGTKDQSIVNDVINPVDGGLMLMNGSKIKFAVQEKQEKQELEDGSQEVNGKTDSDSGRP